MRSKSVEGELKGHNYSVVATSYSDTIHLLVHKDEKIARVFKTQLYPQPGGVISDDGLVAGLHAESLVGGADDISGHLYTDIIGSLILKQNPEENRILVLGLGNVGPQTNADITSEHREELLFVVGLVQQVKSCWIEQ